MGYDEIQIWYSKTYHKSAQIVYSLVFFACVCRTCRYLHVFESLLLPNSTYMSYLPSIFACVCRNRRYLHAFDSFLFASAGPLIPGISLKVDLIPGRRGPADANKKYPKTCQ